MMNELGFPSIPMVGFYTNPYQYFSVPVIIKLPFVPLILDIIPESLKCHFNARHNLDEEFKSARVSSQIESAFSQSQSPSQSQSADFSNTDGSFEVCFVIHDSSQIFGIDMGEKSPLGMYNLV
jgi:hypothetical protein